MLVKADLGFKSLVLLVACMVFPVIGFVIRRKWRNSLARTEEINRLVILASEEAARAELETSHGYNYTAPIYQSNTYTASPIYRSNNYTASPIYQSKSNNYTTPSSNHCTLCFSPTTTRCARCKAVRYCSGKCQIIHWRQGHKENCRPPSGSDSNTAAKIENDYEQQVRKQEHCETYGGKFETEGKQSISPRKTSHEESASSDSGCSDSPKTSSRKENDAIEVDVPADTEKYTLNAFVASLSGSPTLTTSSKSSDNASVSDSSSIQNEPEKSVGYLSADTALDNLETPHGFSKTDQTGSLSPKFASLVDSVKPFNKLSEINQLKPASVVGRESEVALLSSSHLSKGSKHEASDSDPPPVFSSFWRKALDPNGSGNKAYDDSAVSRSNGSNNVGLSDSQSFQQFSSNASGNTSRLNQESSGAKKDISDGALPDTSRIKKQSTDGVNLSENNGIHSSKVRRSPLIDREGSTPRDSVASPASLSLDDSNSTLPPLRSGRSNNDGVPSSISPKSLKSRDVGCLPSGSSDASLSSSIRLQSDPLTRQVKVGKDDMQASSAVSSQVVNSSNSRNGLKTSVRKVVDHLGGSKLSRSHNSGVVSEVAGRHNDKGVFLYDFFVKLYHWKEELRPSGLINCGNSCYANVVLQCLAFTPPLTAYLIQGLHSKACIKTEWCFMCEFESLVLKAKEGKSPLSPIGIISQLQNIGSQLGIGREEDAHEFMRYAIDTMQSICLMEAGVNRSGPLEEEEVSLIGLTFGGYLISKIKCTRCRGKSERQDRIMDLTVEIEGDIGTLEDALRKFTSTEILDGDNKYLCARCKSYVRAKKKLKILEAPNVLTIVLKRFQSGKFGKLNKTIMFPEILNLAPFVSGTSDKSPIYRLYGVVVHLDIMNAAFSGHYVCYVKNVHNKWFKTDDSTVQTTDLEKVLRKGAYMLLYSRCSPRAPRLIRNRFLSSDSKTKGVPSRTGRNPPLETGSASTNSRTHHYPLTTPSIGSSSADILRYQQLQRSLEDDSSSDNSSLISNNSDEGSHSTDSSRDSTSMSNYDLFDNLFGHSRHTRNISSDSDSSSSSPASSPLYSRHSPLADSDRYSSGCHVETGPATADLGDESFWPSDVSRPCRDLASSGRSWETDSKRLGYNNLNNVRRVW